MFLGAETVHNYYKPLADLDLVVEEFRKEKLQEQAEEEAVFAEERERERKKKAAILIMELKKRQANLANDPKDLRKDVDAGDQQTNRSKDKSDSADEETLVL